jgi:hypothetical protein
MLDPRARPLCPGCGGGKLGPVGMSGPAAVWSCAACRGVFAGIEAVARVGRTYGYGHPVLRVGMGPPRCRACKVLLKLASTCPYCDGLAIACAACARPMERVAVERLTVDVCRPCRSVWLDPGELGALVTIWRRREAIAPTGQPASSGVSWIDPTGLSLPDGIGAGLPEVVTGAGEVVITVVQSSGEAITEGVGSIGGVLLDLLGGLFDGL